VLPPAPCAGRNSFSVINGPGSGWPRRIAKYDTPDHLNCEARRQTQRDRTYMAMHFRGLHDAVQQDDVEAVTTFLDEGVTIHVEDEPYGWTPLKLAAYSRRVNVARLLIERGALRSVSRTQFSELLSFAASSNNEDFVRLFLENGTRLLTPGNLKGALFTAAGYSSPQTMALLIEHGAVVITDHLFTAASSELGANEELAERHAQTVGLILDQGIDIDAKDPEKNTALMLSSKSGCLPTVRLLIARGAKINPKNIRGKTALRMAQTTQHTDISRFLSEAGAKL
jgi:ankyrin repeat protein